MALLTSRTVYGLQAMMVLARESDLVSSHYIASCAKIPKNYTNQLLGKMRDAHLVKSIRGVNGGYKLAKDASDISVLEIVKTLEDNFALSVATTSYTLNLFFQEKQDELEIIFDLSLADMQKYEDRYFSGLHYSI